MKKIAIDNDVPAPPRNEYPFKVMDVGDSFLQPDTILGARLRGTIYQYGKRNGKKFVVKKQEPTGYRVWRTE